MSPVRFFFYFYNVLSYKFIELLIYYVGPKSGPTKIYEPHLEGESSNNANEHFENYPDGKSDQFCAASWDMSCIPYGM